VESTVQGVVPLPLVVTLSVMLLLLVLPLMVAVVVTVALPCCLYIKQHGIAAVTVTVLVTAAVVVPRGYRPDTARVTRG
jgi:hypothetical protein